MRVGLFYILLGLCLVWVSATIAISLYLARLARRGQPGTEVMAQALAPFSAGAAVLAAPLGSVLAFVLASGSSACLGRIVLMILAGVLAAFFGANIFGAIRGFLQSRRRTRQRDRVMGQTETLELIKTGAIARLSCFTDGLVLVTYTDNGWVDGAFDWSRAGYADPSGWSMFEAAAREIPGAELHRKMLYFRDDNAHRRGSRG
jgi:hypothetical protein